MLAGVLSTTDPARHVQAIAALRRESGFGRPLLYASTDKLKLPFGLGLIDHLAASGDIWFALERSTTRGTAGGEPELEQLAGFLTGCAYGDLMGTRHPLKRTLIEALRNRTSLIG
jgi:hypothetical protein